MGTVERFAYEAFRPGQQELTERVYEACVGREILLAEAMSGFGKTSAVLTGALSAAEDEGCRVVYACRTKRQVGRVIEEVSRLQRKHPFDAVSVLSKFDYCLLKGSRPVSRESFGWFCSFNVSNNLCSYFLNVPLVAGDFERAVRTTMGTTPAHGELLRSSQEIHVCPYEVVRMATQQAKVVVVPYQYVFDPKVMHALFDRGSLDAPRTILVVDEAHNLRDFLRGVNSALLSMDQVEGAAREAEALLMHEAAASVRCLQRIFETAISSGAAWHMDRESLLRKFREERGTAWLQNLAFELSASSASAWGAIQAGRRMPSLILEVGEFLSKLSSEGRSILVKWERTMALVDPDPVAGLKPRLKEFQSAVLVSATISPSAVFTRSLGLDEQSVSSYKVPAEPTVEVKTVIDKGVSTRYKLRTPEMFSKIADKVAAVVNATDTGVGVFVPSYAVLEGLAEKVSKRTEGRPMVTEVPYMSTQDAAEAFDAFRSGKNAVLVGVQGGRFSEGEDFRDDTMGAVVVVGMSLPPPTPVYFAELASLKRAGEPDSFLMLSRLPALRKAFQAAGRHLRRPGKRGLVFLLDDRFDSNSVRELMPSWMSRDIEVGDFPPQLIGRITRGFWGTVERPVLPS